jgi:hypothetical protein
LRAARLALRRGRIEKPVELAHPPLPIAHPPADIV